MTLKRDVEVLEVLNEVRPKPKPARRKKSERRQLEAELDRVVSEYVRKRDGKCVICGCTEGLTAGHWIARGKKIIRWDLRNVNAQCRSCNLAHNYNPQFYTLFMLNRYGADIISELTIKSLGTKYQFPVIELREMLADMKQKLDGHSEEVTAQKEG